MRNWLLFSFFMLVLSGCSFHVTEETRKFELDSNGIEELVVETSSGDLTINGDSSTSKIEVVAHIERTDNVKDEKITLSLEQEGNKAELISTIEPTIGIYVVQSIDITVTHPPHLHVSIDDQSGDILISNIEGNVNIKDQSGDLTINDVKMLGSIEDDSGDIMIRNSSGEIIIDDQSGDIELEQVTGLSKLKDDSGTIQLENVEGNLELIDQSGDIEIIQYVGDITIDDQSGNITVKDLEGSLSIEDDSGDIEIDQVSQDVEIKSDGSGSKRIEGVKGKVID